jgi:hypothetical protein
MVYSDENEQVLRLKSMHILYVCNVMSNLHQMIIIVIVSLLQVVDSRARSNADGALQQTGEKATGSVPKPDPWGSSTSHQNPDGLEQPVEQQIVGVARNPDQRLRKPPGQFCLFVVFNESCEC